MLDFKQEKSLLKQTHNEEERFQLEEKREEVNKLREITKIIETEQKTELERNLQVFLALNKEERNLRKELVDKQFEVDYKEKYLKKMVVAQHHKHRRDKKEEAQSFVCGFMQAKNLIEKQMKIGKKIKDLKVMRQEKVDLVQRQKESLSRQGEMQAVKTVLFDSNLIAESKPRRNLSKPSQMAVNASFMSVSSSE